MKAERAERVERDRERDMENGGDSLVPQLVGWNLSDSNNPNNTDGLYQVLKAVEAAEATIKQQVC